MIILAFGDGLVSDRAPLADAFLSHQDPSLSSTKFAQRRHTAHMSEFAWGVTSSSVQVEGVHPSADWSVWERAGRVPRSGDGNGFASNFRDDMALIASLAITDIRLTIEWSRIEPSEGKIDSASLDLYSEILRQARQLGLRPWVTLVSTSLPGWFSEDNAGFADQKSRGYHWLRHVDRCASSFDGLVHVWVPIDDPIGLGLRSYGLGSRPPGKRFDSTLDAGILFDNIEGSVLADHLAARHLHSGSGRVMAVRHTPVLFPLSDSETGEDAAAAKNHLNWWTRTLFDSWLGAINGGKLAFPGRQAIYDIDLTDDFDIIGLGFDHPVGIKPTGALTAYPRSARLSDVGFSPLPDELHELLKRVADRVEGRPLVVAANGLATSDDAWRCEVLSDTIDAVWSARTDGIDVVGYFHDTAIDGYEWTSGFSIQKGLIDRDRTPKPSGLLLANKIRGLSAVH